MNKKKRLEELEKTMALPDFWKDKAKAKEVIDEFNTLKEQKEEKYEAIITITASAGGMDAEDFVKILFLMYKRYAENQGFSVYECDSHKTEKDGYKNITIQIANKNAYNLLKNETGVHRLVRISPFNANKQRHTSFAIVDVVPKIPEIKEFSLDNSDLEISFSNSGGPGGQNVNKRETAVRVKHIPTEISVRVEKERSQLQNKELALEILRGKLFNLLKLKRVEKIKDLSFSNKNRDWGSQIRNYVLHPYRLVKDLRVGYEENEPEEVFDGKIEGFIDALKDYDKE